jgi:hypothetical protein
MFVGICSLDASTTSQQRDAHRTQNGGLKTDESRGRFCARRRGNAILGGASTHFHNQRVEQKCGTRTWRSFRWRMVNPSTLSRPATKKHNVSCVCSVPVLVKRSRFEYKVAHKKNTGVCRTGDVALRRVVPCEKTPRPSFLSLPHVSLCLSRACLGKRDRFHSAQAN